MSSLIRRIGRARMAVATAAIFASIVAATPAAGAPALQPAAAAGTLSGRLLHLYDPSEPAIIVTSGRVQFYDYATGALEYQTSSLADGTFSISGVEAGTYRIAVTSSMGSPYTPVREWFSDASSFGVADPIVIAPVDPFNFGDIVIDARQYDRSRLAGADRFGTAAAVAQRGWPDGGGGTVFVVNGLTFPDALSAGAATTDGVLLTVQTNAIPSTVRDQLTRIQPDRIVVVGGTGVVSDAVFTELRDFVANPLDATSVVRIAGSSRYETSRAVIQSGYGFDGAPLHIFLATGRNFPDALSAVPAAISIGGAVLLVDGSAASLDTDTANLLSLVGVPVTIIGGTGAVSAGIETQVQSIVGAGLTNRVSGSDRFETSVEIALAYFSTADYAFIANGFGFADALAAGPLAGSLMSPVYLTRQECVPNRVSNDIEDVLANEIVAVGGTGAVSANALNGVRCG